MEVATSAFLGPGSFYLDTMFGTKQDPGPDHQLYGRADKIGKGTKNKQRSLMSRKMIAWTYEICSLKGRDATNIGALAGTAGMLRNLNLTHGRWLSYVMSVTQNWENFEFIFQHGHSM